MSSTLVFNDNNGRFGNKLFQIAATIATAKKNNLSFNFNVRLKNNHIFNYQLEEFKGALPSKVYNQEQWNYYNIKLDDSYDFRGYYQSELFFKDIKDEIIERYSFNQDFVTDLLCRYKNLENYCSIHVRRNDYLSQSDYYNVMPKEYFDKAIQNTDCKEFLIFSDDHDWCKENFKEYNISIVNLSDWEEFILMSLCKDNIICNSTFGWWAAYLNKNKDKKVIAPDKNKWFGLNYSNLNNKDMYPENWIEINYA